MQGGWLRGALQGLQRQRPQYGQGMRPDFGRFAGGMRQHGEPDMDERGGPPDGDPDDMRMRAGGMMPRPRIQMPRPPMQGGYGMPQGRSGGGIVREDDPRFSGMLR